MNRGNGHIGLDGWMVENVHVWGQFFMMAARRHASAIPVWIELGSGSVSAPPVRFRFRPTASCIRSAASDCSHTGRPVSCHHAPPERRNTGTDAERRHQEIGGIQIEILCGAVPTIRDCDSTPRPRASAPRRHVFPAAPRPVTAPTPAVRQHPATRRRRGEMPAPAQSVGARGWAESRSESNTALSQLFAIAFPPHGLVHPLRGGASSRPLRGQ